MPIGFIKLRKTPEARALLRKPNAFMLLTLIALRAKYSAKHYDPSLLPGEAKIGDYNTIGITRQEYRTALTFLISTGLITIRTTNKGTIAILSDKRVFDTNQPTIKKTTEPTTKQEGKLQEGINNPPTPQGGKSVSDLRQIFESAVNKYPGTKREAGTELHNYMKHKDWKEVIEYLEPAIDDQIKHKQELRRDNAEFIAQWPLFQTWINNRRWEERYGTEGKAIQVFDE